jgi:hypothetical protein
MDEMMETKVEKLIAMGGKKWEKAGLSRIYFNDSAIEKLLGLTVTRYNGGNVSSAKDLNGERVSNSKAHMMLSNSRKAYYDIHTDTFHDFGGKVYF